MKPLLLLALILSSTALAANARAEDPPAANPVPADTEESKAEKLMKSGLGSSVGTQDWDLFHCEDQCEQAYFYKPCMNRCLGQFGGKYLE